GRLYVTTDKDAPFWRVVAVDAAHGGSEALPVVAQRTYKLDGAAIVNHQVVVKWLQDASSRLTIHGLDGAELERIDLPALGTVDALVGDPDDTEIGFDFTSFAYPRTPFRYDFKTGRATEFAHVDARVDASAYEVKQVRYASRDGTEVPMFVVHKKGLALDGRRPTLLSGYGGFNVNITPSFSS